MKQKVVIISTYFPPIPSIASNRMLAFAKYLDKSRFDVAVITLDSALPRGNDPEGVTVQRLPNRPLICKATFKRPVPVLWRRAKSLYNNIYDRLVPLEFVDWRRRAIRVLEGMLKDAGEQTIVVISSFAPADAHLIPLSLKEKGFHFIWIADFRDEMSRNPYLSRWSHRYAGLEQRILARIDGLSTISAVFVSNFKALSPRNDTLYSEIRNGFDFDYTYKASTFSGKEFKVNYFGSIYKSVDLNPLYEALRHIKAGMAMPELKIRLVGVGKSFRLPQEFADIISISDRIPMDQVIPLMKESDALLFLLPNIGWKGVYSGKLFEYLGSRRPIIGLTDPDDVAAELIRDCRAGFIADPQNADEIQKAFGSAYRLWKNRQELSFSDELILAHHRREQVSRLNEMIIQLNK